MKKICVAVMMMAISMLSAEIVTIDVSDDLYIDAEHTEDLAHDQLWVADFNASGHFERTIMTFDLEDLSASQITSATLKIKRFFGCPSGGNTRCKFYAATQYWDEFTWDEHTHVSYDEEHVYAIHNYDVNGWHETELTDLVKKWANHDIANFGLVIKADPNSKFSKFYSKDHPNEVFRPYLEIDKNTAGIDADVLAGQTLLNNYPNPFNPETEIDYSFAGNITGAKQLVITDIRGRAVAKYNLSDSKGSVKFEGAGFVSGVYYANISAGGKVLASRKMLMVK